MPIHPDFAKIHTSMIAQYGEKEGERIYHSWLNDHSCDDTISMDANHKAGLCKVSREVHTQFPFFPFLVESFQGAEKPLKIAGVAIKAGRSRNYWKDDFGVKHYWTYTPEEVEMFAGKLKGAPMYGEHVSYFDAIGKVTDTLYDNRDGTLYYWADVYDKEAIEKIKLELVRHVSIAADYRTLDVVDGVVPHDLHNAELSLVAVAGFPETSVKIMESLRRVMEAKPRPRTDAERAMAHFDISEERWNQLSDKEKQALIDKLPSRGSAEQTTTQMPSMLIGKVKCEVT